MNSQKLESIGAHNRYALGKHDKLIYRYTKNKTRFYDILLDGEKIGGWTSSARLHWNPKVRTLIFFRNHPGLLEKGISND